MKKFGIVCCLTLIMTLITTAVCFADSNTFSITDTYPEDGQSDTSLDNLCVKIFLDENASFNKALDSQKSKFKIVDESGKKEIPFGMKYDEKEHFILIFAYNEESKTTLASDVGVENDAEYRAVISKELTDDNGKALQVDKAHEDSNGNYSISFRTQNMSRTMTLNMVMMGVMFVGIFIFSARAAKKNKEEEEGANSTKKEKINPYEEAKRTGKSVEAILAKEEKRKQKAAKKEEQIRLQKEKEEAEIQAILAEEIRATYYHVKRPRPITEAGGQYKSGRKAKAEAEAKKAEKAKTKNTSKSKQKNRNKAKGKSKGKK